MIRKYALIAALSAVFILPCDAKALQSARADVVPVFMPLAKNTRPQVIGAPAQFFPLSASRAVAPVRGREVVLVKPKNVKPLAAELPTRPANAKNTTMSPQQAQLLLSIFAQNE